MFEKEEARIRVVHGLAMGGKLEVMILSPYLIGSQRSLIFDRMTCEVPTLKRSLTQVSAASGEHCNQPQKTAGSCKLFSGTQDLSESQEKFITDLVLALVATWNSDGLKDLMVSFVEPKTDISA